MWVVNDYCSFAPFFCNKGVVCMKVTVMCESIGKAIMKMIDIWRNKK